MPLFPPPGGGDGAPTDADYLVGTANGDLSAEIVVGTAPAGELGGTWASPTVDATHSGSTHGAAVTTHEGAADPHTGYLKESDFDDIDFLVGTATGHTAAEIVVGTAPAGELGGTWASPTVDALHSGSRHDTAFVDTPNDVAINNVADQTINTVDIAGVAAGDSLIMDAWFTILNNSTATRIITLTMDFDAAFDIELATGALAFSSTLIHPMHMTAIVDIRSTSLAYCVSRLDMQLLAGIASGGDTTTAATLLQAMGWGTSGSNLTGTLTCAFFARSANGTATQTLRLHHLRVEKYTP